MINRPWRYTNHLLTYKLINSLSIHCPTEQV